MRSRWSLRARPTQEGGFTLIEPLIAIVLLGMLAGTLAASLGTSVTAARTTSQKANESNDAQLISGFLVRDAQAAGGSNPFTGTTDPTLGVSLSDPAGCTAPGTLVARFRWLDRAPDPSAPGPQAFVAVYSVSPANPALNRFGVATNWLWRTTCKNGVSQSKMALAHNLSTKPSEQPTATCNPSTACPGLPASVSLRVYEINNPVNGPTFSFTLTAAVRPEAAVAPGPSNGGAVVPLLALGGSSCPNLPTGLFATGLAVQGAVTVTVNGKVIVDATDVGVCKAMQASGSGSLTASTTQVLSGGSCIGNECPTPIISSTTRLGDPFIGLAPPAGTCNGGTNPALVGGHYSPGLYPQALAISGGTVTFDPGIYIFCNGLSISSSANVTATGVLFYFAGGTFDVSGQASVAMSSSTTGTYAGLLLWLPSPPTNPAISMSLKGGGSIAAYNGIIYAPAATVIVGGNTSST
ncbi:MAG: type II secretion system GspH family protein, partial [Actinomycetota bacterium]|nr:type II secretion system GspH family protein [Actinomycetota bacterium]